MTEPTNIDLLNIAMGIDLDEDASSEAQILAAKTEWKTIPKSNRAKITNRRAMRREMFAILKRVNRGNADTLTNKQIALKELIDDQLDPNLGMKWEGFTFIWDLHPFDGPIIIRKEAWGVSGGGYDDLGQFFPSAFTKQVID